MDISDFEGTGPELLPERFLSGELEGWGVVESALGALKSRFSVRAKGTPTPDGVNFTETWTFDHGLVETLSWEIQRSSPGRYIGAEPKVEGEAKGEQAGYAFHWSYTRSTPQEDGKAVTLNFDDWFYLIDERTCIVRGTAGRLGIPFAVVHVTYRKIATA